MILSMFTRLKRSDYANQENRFTIDDYQSLRSYNSQSYVFATQLICVCNRREKSHKYYFLKNRTNTRVLGASRGKNFSLSSRHVTVRKRKWSINSNQLKLMKILCFELEKMQFFHEVFYFYVFRLV